MLERYAHTVFFSTWHTCFFGFLRNLIRFSWLVFLSLLARFSDLVFFQSMARFVSVVFLHYMARFCGLVFFPGMTRLVYLGYSLLWHAPFPWSDSCFDALRVRGFLGSPGTLLPNGVLKLADTLTLVGFLKRNDTLICPGLLTCTARFNGLGFL
jgi:hypothetical protein